MSMDAEAVEAAARKLAHRERLKKMRRDVWTTSHGHPGSLAISISGVTVCGEAIAGIDSVGLCQRVHAAVTQAVLDTLAADESRMTIELLRAGVRA